MKKILTFLTLSLILAACSSKRETVTPLETTEKDVELRRKEILLDRDRRRFEDTQRQQRYDDIYRRY